MCARSICCVGEVCCGLGGCALRLRLIMMLLMISNNVYSQPRLVVGGIDPEESTDGILLMKKMEGFRAADILYVNITKEEH